MTDRARAETIAREIVTAHDVDWETFDGMSELPEWPPPMNDLATAIAAALQSAVEREREQCGAIAEAAAQTMAAIGKTHPENSPERDRCFARAREATSIAAAIRASTHGER